MVFRKKSKGFDIRKVKGRDAKIYAKWHNFFLNQDSNKYSVNKDINWISVLIYMPFIPPLLFVPLLIFVTIICLFGACDASVKILTFYLDFLKYLYGWLF